ncbi:MAG TPA: hypothetical protein VLA76_05765 [Candidatus Angelobacter sp.]|nr:hypothetical protein [Candidatus Angelobacter sp.]
MIRFTRLVPAVVLGIALAACGDAPSPSPSATTSATVAPAPTEEPGTAPASPPATADEEGTPDGWRRTAVPEQGFSIAMPAEWQELSPDVLGDSASMDQLIEANPDAAEALRQAFGALASGQIALFAFDSTGDIDVTGFATNLNVINVGPVEGTAEAAAEEVAESIRQQVPIVGEVEAETTTLPAGDAALLHYAWQIDDGAGTVTTVEVTQYAIIAASGTGFILSMSALEGDAGVRAETFRLIAESIRELPPR